MIVTLRKIIIWGKHEIIIEDYLPNFLAKGFGSERGILSPSFEGTRSGSD